MFVFGNLTNESLEQSPSEFDEFSIVTLSQPKIPFFDVCRAMEIDRFEAQFVWQVGDVAARPPLHECHSQGDEVVVSSGHLEIAFLIHTDDHVLPDVASL